MIILFPVITGILLIASFPRIDQGWVAWGAALPLVCFILRVRSVRGAFAGGFVAAFLAYFVLLMWMPAVLTRYGELPTALAWTAYTMLILVLACYPAAACGAAKYLTVRAGNAFILFFPALWIVMEYAQSISPFGGLPWLLAGYTQSRFSAIIQIADITGVYGISFILIWTGTAFAWLLQRRGSGWAAWAPVFAAFILIAGCVAYGRIKLREWGSIRPQHEAAMLQANISFDEPGLVMLDKFRDGYARMADRLGRDAADLLILPESPSPVSFESGGDYREKLENLASRFPFGIVFNNIRSVDNRDPQYFNSAYFMNRSGVITGIYDKIHLVPFGEYIPMKDLFAFAETITKDVGAFSPGDEYRIVEIGSAPANAVICFEAVFPQLVRRFVQNGSRLIINLTNDGWYGDSAAPHQHLAIARLRAVENRRYLLRAANSGISAIIEPTGKIQASTGIMREAICTGRFGFISTKTVYTRYGNIFILLCAIISCAAAVCARLRRFVNNEPAQEEMNARGTSG